jgi:hypothetical protein
MVGPGTDQWLSDNSAPYVSYTISGDFEAEVKLSVAALTNWVVGGLGVMSSQDPENWIRIVYALDNKVYFINWTFDNSVQNRGENLRKRRNCAKSSVWTLLNTRAN